MVKSVLVAVLALAACKQQGTITLDLNAQTCSAADSLEVYFVKGTGCGTCGCGGCDVCASGACKNVCVNCSPADLTTGLPLDPAPGPGTYAVLVNEVSAGHVSAVACVDGVEIDADGTASRQVTLDAKCCGP